MSLLRRVYFLLFALVIFSGTVYYLGCSSAESTTGKLAFQQQDYKKAEAELKKGLLIDQNDDEGWYMLGYSQIELGKFKDAQESFKRSLAISPAYGEMIKSYWIEKYNAGAREFQSGIDLENKNDKAGSISYYKNALKSFESAAAIIPDSLKSMSAIGETYLALGENGKALDVFNVIAEKSNSPEDAVKVAKVLFESGLGMMQTNNLDAAVVTFKKILSLRSLPKDNPYSETSSYNLGLALAKQGEKMRTDENLNFQDKYREALIYLEPLTENITKKDLEPQLYELLVSVYANLDMTDKAQDALKKKDELKK